MLVLMAAHALSARMEKRSSHTSFKGE